MPPIDPNLLNRIRAVKTLRDRAGTDGEKDAAQHRLMFILAKHKLTESDIPSDSFSTRGRETTHQKMSDFRRKSTSSFWDSTPSDSNPFADFADVIRKAAAVMHERQQNSQQRIEARTKGKNVKWAGILLNDMARACGYSVGHETELDGSIMWVVDGTDEHKLAKLKVTWETLVKDLKSECLRTQKQVNPHNPNAYKRAFFEEATRIICIRISHNTGYISKYVPRKIKNMNPDGKRVGLVVGSKILLSPLVPPF